jgi:hypothetical protein
MGLLSLIKEFVSLYCKKVMEVKNIKIKSHQRVDKINAAKEKFNHMTPKKYLDKQSTCRTVGRLEKKFEYDYSF